MLGSVNFPEYNIKLLFDSFLGRTEIYLMRTMLGKVMTKLFVFYLILFIVAHFVV